MPDVFTEEHWSDTTSSSIGAYEKSKTLAERAAWDFVAAQPEGERIELTVINPGFIIGPTMVKTDFSSGKVIDMFMSNKFPGGIPLLQFATVDVREVAEAHIKCLEIDAAQGKRYITCG